MNADARSPGPAASCLPARRPWVLLFLLRPARPAAPHMGKGPQGGRARAGGSLADHGPGSCQPRPTHAAGPVRPELGPECGLYRLSESRGTSKVACPAGAGAQRAELGGGGGRAGRGGWAIGSRSRGRGRGVSWASALRVWALSATGLVGVRGQRELGQQRRAEGRRCRGWPGGGAPAAGRLHRSRSRCFSAALAVDWFYSPRIKPALPSSRRQPPRGKPTLPAPCASPPRVWSPRPARDPLETCPLGETSPLAGEGRVTLSEGFKELAQEVRRGPPWEFAEHLQTGRASHPAPGSVHIGLSGTREESVLGTPSRMRRLNHRSILLFPQKQV
ncbi:uncharacterized protein LOC141579001 [Camelus bactrianus]|uniref:Uncharacterized protein LOC141579001 n=1 Tax=Camelus bactrianus TaxID=9837 RepID=A0AC58R3V4_CAMBA